MLSKLTIAIPTYNRNDYLVRLLHTIPSNYSGKVLISDNGSSVTEEIKEEFNKFSFICSEQKLEMFQNWNVAVDNVRTEWFVLPSDDDLFCLNSFDKIDEILSDNPLIDIFVFGHNVIDEKDTILSTWSPDKILNLNAVDSFKVFFKGVDARCPSIIIRTELARKMGKFDESFEYTAADSLLIQKCLLYGKSLFVPAVISSYRVWPNNFTSQLISTKGWLNKISMWTERIGLILKKDFSNEFSEKKIKNFKDEIFARNLLAGIHNKKEKEGTYEAIKFAIQNRFPFHADFRTQVVLIKSFF